MNYSILIRCTWCRQIRLFEIFFFSFFPFSWAKMEVAQSSGKCKSLTPSLSVGIEHTENRDSIFERKRRDKRKERKKKARKQTKMMPPARVADDSRFLAKFTGRRDLSTMNIFTRLENKNHCREQTLAKMLSLTDWSILFEITNTFFLSSVECQQPVYMFAYAVRIIFRPSVSYFCYRYCLSLQFKNQHLFFS